MDFSCLFGWGLCVPAPAPGKGSSGSFASVAFVALQTLTKSLSSSSGAIGEGHLFWVISSFPGPQTARDVPFKSELIDLEMVFLGYPFRTELFINVHWSV